MQVESLGQLEQEKIKENHNKLIGATDECNHEYDTDLKKQKLEMKAELKKLLKEHKMAIDTVKNTQETS